MIVSQMQQTGRFLLLVVLLLGGCPHLVAIASELETPPPPPAPESVQDWPQADDQLAAPRPTEASPAEEVRETRGVQVPDQRKLTSILKRNLPAAQQTVPVRDAPEWFQQLMQRVVRDNVPDKYVRDKDWGHTARRWDGVKIRRRGVLDWSTKRRWKEVNHGTWKRYEITQIEPEQNLTMRIENIRDAGGGRLGFDVLLSSKLHAFGRVAQWTKGVQMVNVSADAVAKVDLKLQCELGVSLDMRRFPPDVVLAPSVSAAALDVTEFELQKVSKLKGPLIRELSGSVRDVLLDKIEEKRHRLPEKINRQIAKNEDRLRLSLSDFATSKWETLTNKLPSTATRLDPTATVLDAAGDDTMQPAQTRLDAGQSPPTELLELLPATANAAL